MRANHSRHEPLHELENDNAQLSEKDTQHTH